MEENNKNYLQKAEEHFKAVTRKYPQSEFYEPAQLYLGITYSLQGKNPMAISLLEKCKANIFELCFLIDLPDLLGRKIIKEHGYDTHALIEFKGK